MRAVVVACAALALGVAPAAAAHPVPASPAAPSPAPPAAPADKAPVDRPSAGLSMGVTNDLDSVAFGEPVRYLITVRNDGTAAQKITVRVAAPAMLDDVRVTDVQATGVLVNAAARHSAGVVAWPMVVPANGESTVELRATVGPSFGATDTVAVTACGLPEGTQAPALCATDMDGLLVRRARTAAALPWVAGGAALAVLIAGGLTLVRRRGRARVPTVA